MFQEKPGVTRFTERMLLWLLGAFSFALLVFSLLWNRRFTGGAPVATPQHYFFLFVGGLGVMIHIVLLRQQQRIRALESAVLGNAR